MPGPVGAVVSGVKRCVVSGVAVGGGGARGEVGTRGDKSRRRAVEGRGVAVGERRGVSGGVRGGWGRSVEDRGACQAGQRPSSG